MNTNQKLFDGGVTVSLFWVHVPPEGECIRDSSEFTRAEVDDHVELQEVLGPLGLLLDKELCLREGLQVLVIHYNVNWSTGFEVLPPDFESLQMVRSSSDMPVILCVHPQWKTAFWTCYGSFEWHVCSDVPTL